MLVRLVARSRVTAPVEDGSRKLRLWIEHLIGDAKDCHGLRRARDRGVDKVNHQAVMTAVVMNLNNCSGGRYAARPAR